MLSEEAGLRLGRGDLWTLAGALAYALQIVAIARWSDRVDAVALLAVQSAGVALLLLPWQPPPAAGVLEAADLWRIGYLVVAGTCIAPWLQVRAQAALPAGRIAMLFALEPVFGLLFALGFGGERFAGRWWAGAALIVCAVTWVEWRADAARRRSLPPSG
jgi:drug/metabolite transporter (DMT)-like permease